MDRSRFQYDFLISNDYKGKYDHHLDEIRHLGGRIFYFDYNKNNLGGDRLEELRKFLRSHPEIRGVHVHDTRWQTGPLVLADELDLPIKVIQCHTARARSVSSYPLAESYIYERIRSISGTQFARLACSDLAGIHGFQGTQYDIMPNGIDLDKFTYNTLYRRLTRTKLGIAPETCVVGFVANISPPKNAEMALDVFDEFHNIVPDSKLLMIGNQHGKRDFVRKLKSARSLDSIHLIQAPGMTEMLYPAMDIALCTSISEGLPFTMIEAQATGLPCLISDEVTPMVCVTDLARRFPLEKPAREWAEEMATILRNYPERRSQAEALRAAGYDIKDVANRLMGVYQNQLDTSLS